MVQILLTEPEKCDGCNECIEACEKVLGKSALFLNKMDSGYHAIVCQQCIDPSCARGCFRDAIKRENGTVSIDQESCVGCKLCMLMCPIGAITYTEDGMVKCDQQCIQNPGDTPACVAACEKGCLEAMDVMDYVSDIQRGFEVKTPGSSSITPSSPSSDLAAATQGLCVFCGTCEMV